MAFTIKNAITLARFYMNMKVSYDESLELLKTIPHESCRKAIGKNWLRNANGNIKAHSMCWLFCWAKSGMGSEKAKLEAQSVFDKIFGENSFEDFDARVEHEWAQWARYRYENRDIENQLLAKLNETFTEDMEAAFSKSQGFQVDSKKRKKIELFAMEKAMKEYRELGYDVSDHSKSRPYDLHCAKGTEELFIEVKGTQTSGEEVLLTKNEVEFAKSHKEQMVLYIVSGIKLNDKGDIANEGITKKIKPWDIKKGELIPLSYSYCIEE
jgi:hypothetical protein